MSRHVGTHETGSSHEWLILRKNNDHKSLALTATLSIFSGDTKLVQALCAVARDFAVRQW